MRTNGVRICAFLALVALMTVPVGSSPGEVIWAVNCGGDSHVDEYGIAYMRDPLQRIGVASDFGRSLLIQRVSPSDQILYQTERYHTQSFTYEVPISREGDYVLVMKFCEVWFTQPNQKVVVVVVVVVDFLYCRKVFRIGTVRYNWPMSAHASQVFSIALCTDSEDLPF